MPSIDHESLVELFRNRPRLAVELIRDALGLELPDFDSVPVILDPDRARSAPELAVLSAIAHGNDQDTDKAVQIALAAATAVRALPEDQCALYLDMILAALSAAARKAFEMIPQGYEFQSDVGRSGQLRGLREGQADAILRVLAARGLPVSDEQRERINTCTDLDTLRAWVSRAATVPSTAELFTDDTE